MFCDQRSWSFPGVRRVVLADRWVAIAAAHGGTIVKVGTIDVKTGKRLTTADVIPEDKRAEALAKVREA